MKVYPFTLTNQLFSGALDKGVTYSPDEHDGSDAKVRQVPSMSDMLICYPTQMGEFCLTD